VADPIKSHLNRLTTRNGNGARYGRHADLAAWASSDDFMTSLAALPPKLRLVALASYARAWAKCEAKAPVVRPATNKVAWAKDEFMVARLRKLAPRFPNTPDGNAELAAAMGRNLTVAQVRLARRRYSSQTAPMQLQKAA